VRGAGNRALTRQLRQRLRSDEIVDRAHPPKWIASPDESSRDGAALKDRRRGGVVVAKMRLVLSDVFMATVHDDGQVAVR
jgi:hypothetical protein